MSARRRWRYHVRTYRRAVGNLTISWPGAELQYCRCLYRDINFIERLELLTLLQEPGWFIHTK